MGLDGSETGLDRSGMGSDERNRVEQGERGLGTRSKGGMDEGMGQSQLDFPLF